MRNDLRVFVVVSAIALVIGVATPARAQFLYAGNTFGPDLFTINPVTGGTDAFVPVTAVGIDVNQVKGLAAEPATGELYAVLRGSLPEEGGGSRSFFLATIRPDTGEATVIGELGDAFAGLAFAGDGTLYGVTGDGAQVGSTLYTIDTNDASSTEVVALGNGSAGETIAFNSADGMMYHLSGENFPREGDFSIVFEKINLGTLAVTDIPLSGDFFFNGNGLAYDATQGNFVVSVTDSGPDEGFLANFARISTTGNVSLVGFMDIYAGGMAFSDFVPVELMSFSVE